MVKASVIAIGSEILLQLLVVCNLSVSLGTSLTPLEVIVSVFKDSRMNWNQALTNQGFVTIN